MNTRVNLLTPVGRLVGGSLYNARTKDAAGNPITIKSGPNLGQPASKYYFALAIPKGVEPHWAHTEWGSVIWNAGHSFFTQREPERKTFAWKISDGDSVEPNGKGHKPCEREGYAGHWILHFSSFVAPIIVNDRGDTALIEKDLINPGDYIQVSGNIKGNSSLNNPGIHLNFQHVALIGYGPRIVLGPEIPDPKTIGFGGALPPGASKTPLTAHFNPAAISQPAAQYAPPAAAPTNTYAPPPATAYAPPSVTPHPGILNPPGNSAIAPPPIAAPIKKMLPTAQATYEQYIAAGWTDQLLIQHGFMAP